MNGAKTIKCWQITLQRWTLLEKEIIEETPLTLFINGQEWLTVMCTPVQVEQFVLGFLAAEKIITCFEDVSLLDITHRGRVADVWLRRQVTLPRRQTLTSGCGGGTTFADLEAIRPPVRAERQVTVEQVLALMQQLQQAAHIYQRSQGVHTSALSDGDRLLVVAEDVGRHNTLDKVRGGCLQQGLATEGHLLLTTGRISSEMLRKAADMEIPIVISRTSPTSLSLSLARTWGITVIGYVRGRQMRVYSEPQRVELPTAVVAPGNNSHCRGVE
jgi:FdhD protein